MDNLLRSSLVVIFLRKLEYCTGILFLTMNRVSEVDAILSSSASPVIGSAQTVESTETVGLEGHLESGVFLTTRRPARHIGYPHWVHEAFPTPANG
jgi:hypothetical protein